MKKSRSLLSYGVMAAFVSSLGLGPASARAGDLPTLVELHAAPMAIQSPIVLAAIDRIAKSITDAPQSKQGKKAFKKLTKIQDKVTKLENDIKALKQQLENPSLSTSARAKLEKQLADKTGQLLDQKTKVIVQQQRVDLAEAKAQEKEANKELKRATKSGASQDELNRLRKIVDDAHRLVEKQKQDVQDARNGKPFDDSNEGDPKASPSR